MDDFDTLLGGAAPRLAERTPALRAALGHLVGESEALSHRRRPRWPVFAAGLIGLAVAGGGAAATARTAEQVAVAPLPARGGVSMANEGHGGSNGGDGGYELSTCVRDTSAADLSARQARVFVLRRVQGADASSQGAGRIVWPSDCTRTSTCIVTSDPRSGTARPDLACSERKP